MGLKLFVLAALALGAGLLVWRSCGCCAPRLPPVLDDNEWWGATELRGKTDTAVRPFTVQFSDQMVKDLRDRLANRRPLTPPLEGAAFTYGFNSVYLQKVLDFWQNSYNFKERETFLNKFKQFKTNIQGLDIHFIHVKPDTSKLGTGVKVVPLLLLHGWPGSVREFYEAIPLLTTPRAGYNFVFEVVVPSLPGYGFSSGAVRPGLGPFQVAVVMKNLMLRLGHQQYYVQGGDWGAIIASAMATLFPTNVLGLHSNMAFETSKPALYMTLIGSVFPSLVLEGRFADRMYPLSNFFSYIIEESGYLHIQASKPDTIGVSLTDSPAGLAAYILEKFSTWTNTGNKLAVDGNLTAKFQLVDLLDNLMLYWSTNSITTSVRLYAESMTKKTFELDLDNIPTPVPAWVLQARHEITYMPPGLLMYKFTNLLGSTPLEDGGHFLAFELPQVLVADVFKAVQAFFDFHANNSKTEL